MMKCVLDTNVIVSGIVIPDGAPGKVLRAGLAGEYQLSISRRIPEEIEQVMEYPKIGKWLQRKGKASGKVRIVLQEIDKVSIKTPGKLKIQEIKADPKDNMFLACAVEGKADCIISGDRHLLDLREYQGIPIVRPAEFFKIHQSPVRR